MVGSDEMGDDVTRIIVYMCQVLGLPDSWIEHINDDTDVMNELRTIWKTLEMAKAHPEFAPEPVTFEILDELFKLLEHPIASSTDIDYKFGQLIYYLTQESNYNSVLLKCLIPHMDMYLNSYDGDKFIDELFKSLKDEEE